MALFKYQNFFDKSFDGLFDQIHFPPASTPASGIYRCEGCGKEITSEANNPLPPQNHHQHKPAEGRIRWRLIAYADHRSK